MPISYRIDPSKRRVYVTGSGVISRADLFGTQQRLSEDPSFEPTFSQLFDLSAAESIDLTTDEMSALAERTAFTRGARRAIVANRAVIYGMARMFDLFADSRGGELELFPDIESATHWLDAGFDAPPPRLGDAAALDGE